jgi:regulator of protease activity HflC (stomatin/prohibitin superfamily)
MDYSKMLNQFSRLAAQVIIQNAQMSRNLAMNSAKTSSMNSAMNSSKTMTVRNLSTWPISKVNTCLNILPQGTTAVIERLGKYNRTRSGLFFAIPLIDNIKYLIDRREQSIRIDPLHAITSDNINIMVSGNLYFKFVDEQKASYGSDNPVYNIQQFAISSMRNSIGNMELDTILKSRQDINRDVTNSLENAAGNWGVHVTRYEITDLKPDKAILESMNIQSIAERNRREQILTAKGNKESAQLISEGERIRIENEANAHKYKVIAEAQARAESIELDALSKAKYIKIISDSLEASAGSEIALQSLLAMKNMEMMQDIGQKSNTMFFSEKPADFKQLMAVTSEIMKVTK